MGCVRCPDGSRRSDDNFIAKTLMNAKLVLQTAPATQPASTIWEVMTACATRRRAVRTSPAEISKKLVIKLKMQTRKQMTAQRKLKKAVQKAIKIAKDKLKIRRTRKKMKSRRKMKKKRR